MVSFVPCFKAYYIKAKPFSLNTHINNDIRNVHEYLILNMNEEQFSTKYNNIAWSLKML